MYRLASDISYERDISLVVTFLQTLYQDKMQQWIEGFVRESIEAYKSSSNSTSCSKGIRERTGTGLRGIDTVLDKLFAQAEGPMLMSNWLKTWDLTTVDDKAKQKLVDRLKGKGITGKSSVEDVVNSFRVIATEYLKANGLDGDKGLQEEIEAYAESMIDAYYEKELKPYVVGDLKSEEKVISLKD